MALVLWLVSRVLDGLDGAVARIVGASEIGGFFDVVADFTVYGSFLVGVAIAVPEARLANGDLEGSRSQEMWRADTTHHAGADLDHTLERVTRA